MIAALFTCVFAAITSADAIVTVLNSRNSCSAKRYAEARELLAREAAEGKPVQRYVVGLTIDEPNVARAYLDASRDLIRAMAEKKNNALAWYLLSMEDNDVKKLERAAELGNLQALNALGTIEVSRTQSMTNAAPAEIEKVYRRSFECFSKAAAQRDPNAFINLGTCYLRGFGCEQNLEVAFQCFRSAAEAGHPEGMDYVAAALQNGHGVKQDLEASLVWTMKARALRGDKAAETWLKKRK